MGVGSKKLNINGWVGHNGGADLKMQGEGEGGGNPFQINFGI